MAKINRIEDLPEWFDLKKYKACESFGAVDWYNCLSVRKGALRIMAWITPSSVTVEQFYGAYKPHEIMRADPLNWAAVYDIHSGLMDGKVPPPQSPVRALKFTDLVFQRDFDCESPTDRAELWNQFDNRDWMEASRRLSGVSIGVLDGCMETIKVDMSATDAVLIAAFSAWLEEARKQPSLTMNRASQGIRERPDYKDWVGYGVLPYLDLMIWEKETGNEITHQVMAQAVGYIRGGDSFRKTVVKLAKKLMYSLAELEALANWENASASSASAE